MSTIQSRTPEKKAKNHVTLTHDARKVKKELRKLIFCTWIRGSPAKCTTWGQFNKTFTLVIYNAFFGKILKGDWVKQILLISTIGNVLKIVWKNMDTGICRV